MKCMNNERGIALVTALLLTLISLAIILSVLYIITQGIQVSGSHKRYKNALEASYASIDVLANEIMPRLLMGNAATQVMSDFNSIGLNFGSYNSCLQQKLMNPTGQWGTTACGPDAAKINPKANYDAMFTLKGLPLQGNYNVYTQIISTQMGNSNMTGVNLDSGSGVTGNTPGINPVHIPSLYTIEVHGEKDTNPLENTRLSVLYAY